MKRKRHGPDQIIAKLREADTMLNTGASIGQVCQRLEASEATFHRWRIQYGGMKALGGEEAPGGGARGGTCEAGSPSGIPEKPSLYQSGQKSHLA